MLLPVLSPLPGMPSLPESLCVTNLSHLAHEMLSVQQAILGPSNPVGHLLQLLSPSFYRFTHSFMQRTAMEHLTVPGREGAERMKTRAPEALIWLKCAFPIDKIAVKKDSFFC